VRPMEMPPEHLPITLQLTAPITHEYAAGVLPSENGQVKRGEIGVYKQNITDPWRRGCPFLGITASSRRM
jgi:hypothetical protein